MHGQVSSRPAISLCSRFSTLFVLVVGNEASELGKKEPGRFIQCFVYVRASPDDNFYAHPLDIVVVVELQTKRVLQWWHHKANPIIPTLNSNFHTKLVDQERGWRTGLKPLNVVQPEGPSFSVDGNMVFWQKWSMRVSFNYREGLVLHTVGSVLACSLSCIISSCTCGLQPILPAISTWLRYGSW